MDLDHPTLEALKRRAKQQLRSRMRSLRAALPPTAAARRSAAIVQRLAALPALATATRVALFWPMDDRREIDLRALDALLRERGARVYYPFLGRDSEPTAGFACTPGVEDLVEAGHGFREPRGDLPAAPTGQLDLIVVPALAVGADGHRLGYGSGFYDAVLPFHRPPATAVVVAHDFQLLAELPTTPGDVAVDLVVTEERVIVVEPLA